MNEKINKLFRLNKIVNNSIVILKILFKQFKKKENSQ